MNDMDERAILNGMPKISMLVPDDLLAEIDAQADGNRTAFMLGAALERARRARREKIDREIIAALDRDAEPDAIVYNDWEVTLNDGND